MNQHDDAQARDDDADVARALQLAARRPVVSDERRAAAFARVHAEWRAATAVERPVARGRWRAALAAGLAAGVVAVALLSGRVADSPGAELALASVVQGAELVPATGRPWQLWGKDARTLAAGAAVHADETLRTGPHGVALLRLGSTLALRVAPQSELRFDAPDRVTLLRGQVYVDSGSQKGEGAPLTVATAQGEVRHLGTRYLVRADAATLDVAVRDGRVLLAAGERRLRAEAMGGERLRLVAGAGAIERATLAPDDPAYAWLARIPAPFAIEGRTLGDFVRWYEAETGRRVELGARTSIDALRGVRLSGSVAGMSPDEALDTVAAVTDLAVDRVDGRVRIDIAP